MPTVSVADGGDGGNGGYEWQRGCKCLEVIFDRWWGVGPNSVGISDEAPGWRTMRVLAQVYDPKCSKLIEAPIREYTFDQAGLKIGYAEFKEGQRTEERTHFVRRADGQVELLIYGKAKETEKAKFAITDTIGVNKFSYDAAGRQMHWKARDPELPDTLPNRSSAEGNNMYDAQGRLISSIDRYVTPYDRDSFYTTTRRTTFEYTDDVQGAKIRRQLETFTEWEFKKDQQGIPDTSVGIIHYDSQGLAISEYTEAGVLRDSYTYDDKNRLVSVRHTDPSATQLVCHGGRDYVCEFFYGAHGLISGLRLSYDDEVCELRFVYE